MIRLTERLKLMADNITKGETMADIGTDHGFLPAYLYENDISNKVILADVSKGSLDKARKNCERYGESFDFRLGDGLSILENGEVDVVAIAGMGGKLIADILSKDISKTKTFKKFILQPRNGQGELRYWLSQNGFLIEKEILVREGKFICEILVVKPNTKSELSSNKENDISYELPKALLEQNGSLAIEFFERKLDAENKILKEVSKASMVKNDRKSEIENRIKYIENMLAKYK